MDRRYAALIQERADLVQEGDTLVTAAEVAGRELTEEESERYTQISARLQVLAHEIAVEERMREARRAVAAGGAQIIVPPALPGVPSADGGLPAIATVLERAGLKPWGYDTYRGDNQQKKAEAALGEMLIAIHKARMTGQVDPRLAAYQAAAQGAGIATPEDGGFFVGETVSDEIMLRAAGGEVLSRVRRSSLSAGVGSVKINLVDESSRATGSRYGGVQGYWVDEGTAPTAGRPKFFQERWEPHKLACLGYATEELLTDAALLGNVMFRAFVEEVRFLTENAIFRGIGAGSPQGILNCAALISVAAETGQSADTVVYENIVKMYARCYGPIRRNAVWLYNQDIEPQLFTMNLAVGTGGVPVYLPPSNSAANAPHGSLFGRPLVPIEYASTLGDAGDLVLAVLDEYFLVDKGAPQQATSMHVAFTTDEQAFKLTWRVDGHPLWRTTLTPFQGSATQSPFVALAAR